MPFFCKPSGLKARTKAKAAALRQQTAGLAAHTGVSLRLLLVDRQISPHGHLAAAALDTVHVVEYDSATATRNELVGLVREAHRQNGTPFLSIACANHGADAGKQWAWASDLAVDLRSVHGALNQLAPMVECLTSTLCKTHIGHAHIDFLACGLATTCKGLVPALEKMYGVDFRASTDDTGNDINQGNWKMETDDDYDVSADYLDATKLQAYAEKMNKLTDRISRVFRSITHRKDRQTRPLLPSNHVYSDSDCIEPTASPSHSGPAYAMASVSGLASAEREGNTMELSAEVEAKVRLEVAAEGQRYGADYKVSAEFEAMALVSAKAAGTVSVDGVSLSADVRALINAEATIKGHVEHPLVGSADAELGAAAQLTAFATAEAMIGPDGCKMAIGAYIAAECEAHGTFEYRSPTLPGKHFPALVIKATASVGAGIAIGGGAELGVMFKGGVVVFGGKVQLALVVGGGLDIEVSVDVTSLAALLSSTIKAAVHAELDRRRGEARRPLLARSAPRSSALGLDDCEGEAVLIGWEEATDAREAFAGAARKLFGN